VLLELFWEASITVKMVMLVLVAMSVYSWSIIISKTKELRARCVEIAIIHECLNEYDNPTKAWQILTKTDGYFSNILKDTYKLLLDLKKGEDNINEKIDIIKEQLDLLLDREMQKVNMKFSILATIGSVSPYIGLFGTVYGIMISFIALGESTAAATLESVAPGIAEALIATGFGLFAAIPAYIAYNMFFSKISEIEEEYNLLKEEFYLNLRSFASKFLKVK
jgi:biopolymer transport protein TolQ